MIFFTVAATVASAVAVVPDRLPSLQAYFGHSAQLSIPAWPPAPGPQRPAGIMGPTEDRSERGTS